MSAGLAFEALTFASPMPGLEAAGEFSLRPVSGAEGLYALEASEPQIRLFLADAAVYVPDYAPAIPVATLEALGLSPESPDGAGTATLVVVNPTPEKTTVNLMAPILLNRVNGLCVQVILDGVKYPMKAELGS
jgi:flagellar assembly factor FliW